MSELIKTDSDLSKLTYRQQTVLLRLIYGNSKEAIASLMESVKREFDPVRLFTSYLSVQSRFSKPVQERPAELDPSWAVVIVEKDLRTREDLARILASRKLRIATTVSSVEDLAGGLLPRDRPILLVLGSHNESANTAAQIKAFRQQYPHARIAIVADNHDTNDAVMAFGAGANGYVAKLECNKDLIKALELVMSGQTLLVFGQEFTTDGNRFFLAQVEAPAGSEIPRFSPRERLILECIIAGDSNKVIARRIGMAEGTVKVHIKSILRKIRV